MVESKMASNPAGRVSGTREGGCGLGMAFPLYSYFYLDKHYYSATTKPAQQIDFEDELSDFAGLKTRCL